MAFGTIKVDAIQPDTDSELSINNDTTRTNNIQDVLTLTHTTSGTPANNIGVAVAFVQETSVSNNETIARISAVATDTTSTAEDGAIVFETMDAGAAPTERMRIDSSGRVGIGTSSPEELLEIEDGNSTTTFQISNYATDGDPQLSFALSGVKIFTMGVDDSDSDKFKIGTTAISTNTRLAIDSSGNVGIGDSAPDCLLQLKTPGSGTTVTFRIRNSGDVDKFHVREDGYIYAPGLIANTGTDVVSSGGYLYLKSSSKRYKDQILPIDIGLEFIKKLKPVKYNLKIVGEQKVGFIAEDVEALDKRLVSYSKINQEDENSELQVEGVMYSDLAAVLTKAIQEQQAIIENQQTQIDALVTRIEALEATP